MTETTDSPASKGTKNHRGRTIALAALLILITGTFGVLYAQSRTELNRLRRSPSQLAATEAETIIKKISTHMSLPSQKPTIATVEDSKKLADQPFFKHARNGDKVLIYTQSKKAILYRPSEDKIIEVAYLNMKQTAH